MTTITIVTPVLNGAAFIRQTIESVLGQKGDFELEYLLCDAGSRDGTVEIINEYKGHCRLIQRTDSGPADAINFAFSQARGDCFGWLGADDLLLPGALNLVAQVFAAQPEILWLYGRCRIIDDQDREIRRAITWYKNLLGWRFSRKLLETENFISQPATFWRSALWHKCGGLASGYRAAFDYDLWLRFAAIAAPLPIPDYLAAFRRHPHSISERSFKLQFAEELAIAKGQATILPYLVHCLNYHKIRAVYSLLEKTRKLRHLFTPNS